MYTGTYNSEWVAALNRPALMPRVASNGRTGTLCRKKPEYKQHLTIILYNIGDGPMKIQNADKRVLHRLPAGEFALCRWIGSGWTVHRLRMVPKAVRRVRPKIKKSRTV